MTATAESWLPAPALFDGALLALIQEQVGGWSRHWLTSPAGVACRQTGAGRKTGEARGGIGSSCGRVRLALDRPARMRLAGAMLGLRRAWFGTERADLALLDRAANAAMSDLFARLAGTFGMAAEAVVLDAAPARTDAAAFSVSLAGGRLFDLGLGQDAAVFGRKSRIAPGRALPALASRREAVDLQTIAIGASAGAGHVDLAELRTLVAGDVLVLDRPLAAGLGVTLNGRPLAAGAMQVKQDGARLFIVPDQPERGSIA